MLTLHPSLGLGLEGASWSDQQLEINDGQSIRLPPCQIRWVQQVSNEASSLVNLPVYLNSDRSDVLFTVHLPFKGGASRVAAMRAICLTAS